MNLYVVKLEFIKKEILSIDLQMGIMRGEAFRKRLRRTEQWCGLLKAEPGFVFFIIVIYTILVDSESFVLKWLPRNLNEVTGWLMRCSRQDYGE